ncbi:MAG: cell division protein FtsA [Dehalococcoidia bacterium]|nr:cell division protein FtsA [Dehalococcoidia bacterium]
MDRDLFYTGIDLGTSKVCTIIARIGPEGEIKVLGIGIVPSQGVQKGRVDSPFDTQNAIKASLEEAQRYLGRGITSAYLSVTGDHISCLNTTGSLDEPNGNGAISSEDVQNLIQSSYPDVADSKEVLHVIPMTYEVDGLTEVRNPVGLYADRVRVDSHVVLGDAPTLKNLVRSVEDCKISVRSLVVQPLAAAEATLTEDEREMGVMLLDIGGGTTDMVIFRSGSPWYTSVIPVGGNLITRDLSAALGVPSYAAEELKIKWGHAIPDEVPSDQEVPIPGFQGQPPRTALRRHMCIPIRERLFETLKFALVRMQGAGLRQLPPGGMVITGGTAQIPGLQGMAEKMTGARVRIASPILIPGLPSELINPTYSASVGTLLWGMKHQGEKRPYGYSDKTLQKNKPLISVFRRKTQETTV